MGAREGEKRGKVGDEVRPDRTSNKQHSHKRMWERPKIRTHIACTARLETMPSGKGFYSRDPESNHWHRTDVVRIRTRATVGYSGYM